MKAPLLRNGFKWGILFGAIASTFAGSGSQWSGFRGDGTSVTVAQDLPLHWSETNNIRWRIQLAGAGQSSPVIWNDRVYVTSVVGPRKEKLVVQAIALASGKEIWRFAVDSSLPEELSNMRSQAAPTPVAEPDGVFAFFESGDCFALTHGGKLRWCRNVSETTAKVNSNHGLGGSPILFERGLFVPLDQSGPSCLLAMDRTTGATLWKALRPDKTSWSTPVVARRGDEFLIILSGGGTVSGYDAEIGTMRFEVTGIVKNNVPSPTIWKDILIIGASSKGSNLALELSKDTFQKPAELWRSGSATCGFASPLVHHGRVYFVSSAGIVSCLSVQTGNLHFEERLGEGAWASPIGASDRVYIFGEKGKTTILAAADEFRILQTNQLVAEKNVTGVAATDGAFIVRAATDLICIGTPSLQP